MAAVTRPTSWAEAGLDSAVFSDPGPTAAVIAAIHEREALFPASYDTYLAPVELVRWCQPEARRERYDFLQKVREVPNRLMASIIYHKIQMLSYHFVDLEYDYAARDWSEFPVMLSERFARGEHSMAWCPDYSDPESDAACTAWRSFLADARWWLDRMHVVPVDTNDARFGRRTSFGSSNDPVYTKNVQHWVDDPSQVYEEGQHIADLQSVTQTSTDGSYTHRSGNYRLGAYARLRVVQSAECEWWGSFENPHYYLRHTSRNEYVSGLAHSRLRVRNYFPVSASVVVFACGAGEVRGNYLSRKLGVRTDDLQDFTYQTPVGYTPICSSSSKILRKAYVPSSLSPTAGAVFMEQVSDLSGGEQTLRGWSHDFTEYEDPPRTSALDPFDPCSYPPSSHPPTVTSDREWDAIFRPGLLGLSAGPNVLATLAPGARTTDLIEWSQAGLDAIRAETWWLPAALHGYSDKNESSDADVVFAVAVVPCLDFEDSFRFRADTEQEEQTP